LAVPLCGCTPLGQYIRNGLKVGPNYQEPPAPVATHWIDVADKRVRNESDDLSQWWTVFHDPVLDSLVCYAYRQNLTLQQAGFKVLTARAQRNMAIGNLFPQTQDATGDYQRIALSTETANRSFIKTRFFGQWDFAFSLAWSWISGSLPPGRRVGSGYARSLRLQLRRRPGHAASDVATAYVQIRTLEQQIKLTRANVALQRTTLTIARPASRAARRLNSTSISAEQLVANRVADPAARNPTATGQ